MKKLILLLLLSVTVLSCSNSITVVDQETGQVLRTRDVHRVTKVGDTIVLYTTSNDHGYRFYGKYLGKTPEKYISKQGAIMFNKTLRIK